MPWMCLERCGEDISPDLAELQANSASLTAVSFEDYDLGPNSAFIINNFTNVNDDIHNMGLLAFPMITTVNLTWLRELFAKPEPFIQAAVQRAQEQNHDGYNIDFEPTDAATDEDAMQFANFLTQFADSLHQVDKNIGVCVASWNTFWNFTALSQSSVDKVITMDTYAGGFSDFASALQFAYSHVDLQKLGVGLITSNPDNNQPFSIAQLKERFELIESYGVNEIDIWDTPIPNTFWPFLQNFIDNGK